MAAKGFVVFMHVIYGHIILRILLGIIVYGQIILTFVMLQVCNLYCNFLKGYFGTILSSLISAWCRTGF